MIEVFGTLVATLAALGTFVAWRSAQLRRDEVLEWGTKCVEVLQSLQLKCDAQVRGNAKGDAPAEQAERISILVEQGRLFFKNASPGEYGTTKELAYRGYRPVILDQLVFAYMVASDWHRLSPADQNAGLKVVTTCKERFVSLLQREVGRRRAADRYNIEGGSGYDLPSLLAMAHAGESPVLPAENKSFIARGRRLVRF